MSHVMIPSLYSRYIIFEKKIIYMIGSLYRDAHIYFSAVQQETMQQRKIAFEGTRSPDVFIDYLVMRKKKNLKIRYII